MIKLEEVVHNKYTRKTIRRTVFLRPEAVVMIIDDPKMTSTLKSENVGVSAVSRLLVDAVTSRREIYVVGSAESIRSKMSPNAPGTSNKEILNG